MAFHHRRYYHGSRSILRITKNVAILRYLTLSLSHALVHLSINSYNYSSSASAIVMSTHTPPYFTVLTQNSKADGGYLVYTELTIHYGTKELATSSQFHLWMTKQAID